MCIKCCEWQQLENSALFMPILVMSDLSYYSKCLVRLYTKVSDKVAYANGANPDQTAPEQNLIRVYTVCLSTNYFKKQLLK